MIANTADDCWHIATSEAERYQNMITERMSGIERIKYMARRNASTRIARLIRLGTCECAGGSVPDSAQPTIVIRLKH